MEVRSLGPANRLLEAAAAPTMERIRRDRQKAPTQLQPLLAYLETHLFDSDLDANQLKRACGVRDNSLPIYFHHALSLPPYAYIEDCRLEVACRLLRDSDLKVWQIAQLLGYSTLQVFSRAFDRWSGLRPSIFRRRSRESDVATAGNGTSASGSDAAETRDESSLIGLTTLRKAINGGLDHDQADELARQLVRLYPESFRRAAENPADRGGEAPPMVAMAPTDAWSLIESRPRQEWSKVIESRFQVASVDLFRMLVDKSMEEVRRDSQRGIGIAHLAIDCLEALAGSLTEDELRELEVKGYSWLSNAYRILFELPEAETYIQRAEASLRPSCDTLIKTEFVMIKSAVRLVQGRHREALSLADQAVSFLDDLEQPEIHVRTRLQRARTLHQMGDSTGSIAELWRVHEMSDEIENKNLLISLYHSLSVGLALAGRAQEAAKYLPVARSLLDHVDLKDAMGCLEWAEALIEIDLGDVESAEARFRAARESFYNQGQAYLGALAALDLSILCAEQGRFAETIELAGEVVETFTSLNVQQETLQGLHVLQKAIAAQQLTQKTLRKVRAAVVKSQP